MTHAIRNPILPGFHPDPSILRVGGDYYIATSTFEWFPGVRIHHSRDLVHWRLLGDALDRPAQLALAGNPRSGGVWAPCLSHDGQRFHLVYTDVKAWGHGFVDAHNYLVTAETIEGPWSDPVRLSSSGFDPSLFHDVDGRKWLVNMQWDHRPGRNPFAGVLLQEYSPRERRLVGPITNIFAGSPLGATEAPHLYRRGGFYYLMVAEGGTSWDHAVTLARSRALTGPYEPAPNTPLLTSRGDPSLALQKAGHASLVETPDGRAYLAHLCGRPRRERRCPLGRETALQEVRWTDDGWLELADGGTSPRVEVAAPALPAHPWPPEPSRHDFASGELSSHFQTLRTPATDDWLSLTEGVLRLRGRESPRSLHRQSLVALRLEAFTARFRTRVTFAPTSFQQMAGLVAWYDDESFAYLHLTWDDALGLHLGVLVSRLGELSEHAEPVRLDRGEAVLEATFADDELRFAFAPAEAMELSPVGEALDATMLSDEHTTLGLGFTGTFVGLAAHDMTGRRLAADFAYLEAEQSRQEW